jgi:hypothetical protein
MAVVAAAVTDVARRRQRRNSAQGRFAARLHDVSRWDGARGGCVQRSPRRAGICQEAEVTDATEALGQCVEQKATDELVGGRASSPCTCCWRAIVLPAKADTAIIAGEQTAVADRDASSGLEHQDVVDDHLVLQGDGSDRFKCMARTEPVPLFFVNDCGEPVFYSSWRCSPNVRLRWRLVRNRTIGVVRLRASAMRFA